jgi:hypothetical protein
MKGSTLRNERGVTLALMAVTMFIALGLAALAIDYGMIKAAKAETQRGVDAAALAGASAYQLVGYTPAQTRDSAKARARKWISTNKIEGIPLDSTHIDSIVTVSVPVERIDVWYTQPGLTLWFARMFGSSTMSIKAHAAATAVVGGIRTNCLKPFLIPDIWKETSVGNNGEDANSNKWIDNSEKWNYVPSALGGTDTYAKYDPNASPADQALQTGYGSAYRGLSAYPNDKGLPFLIKPQLGNNESRHGNWYYTLDGPEGNLRDDIESGCISAAVGDPPTVAKGGKTGQARQGVQYLFDQDPTASFDTVNHRVVSSLGENSPRVIIVGLFDPKYIQGTSRLDKPDAGMVYNNFAKIFIDARPNGNDDITARFVGFLSSGGSGGPVSCSNCKTLRLVE